jgi:hypothetical protein
VALVLVRKILRSSASSALWKSCVRTVTDFLNALPDNSSVNTIQHATVHEAVFSVDPTDVPIDWLDSDHMICVYCRSVSVPRLYNKSDNSFRAVNELRVSCKLEE